MSSETLNLDEAWKSVHADMEETIGAQHFESFFAQAKLARHHEGVLTVSLPSAYQRRWAQEQSYHTKLAELWEAHTGEAVEVVFVERNAARMIRQPKQVEASVKKSTVPSSIPAGFRWEVLSIPSRCQSTQLKIENIQQAVCEVFGNITQEDLLSSRRTKMVVWPRHLAMYLCKAHTLRSYCDIGRKFGDRDHTTVMSGVRKIEALVQKGDADTIADIERIREHFPDLPEETRPTVFERIVQALDVHRNELLSPGGYMLADNRDEESAYRKRLGTFLFRLLAPEDEDRIARHFRLEEEQVPSIMEAVLRDALEYDRVFHQIHLVRVSVDPYCPAPPEGWKNPLIVTS